MSLIEKISQAFKFKSTIEEKENVFKPRIQSTVMPEKVDFNEVSKHIYEQIKSKYHA